VLDFIPKQHGQREMGINYWNCIFPDSRWWLRRLLCYWMWSTMWWIGTAVSNKHNAWVLKEYLKLKESSSYEMLVPNFQTAWRHKNIVNILNLYLFRRTFIDSKINFLSHYSSCLLLRLRTGERFFCNESIIIKNNLLMCLRTAISLYQAGHNSDKPQRPQN
jgi:hypothetical protein